MHHCRWRMSHKTKHYQETAKMTNIKGLNVHSWEVISTFNTGRDVLEETHLYLDRFVHLKVSEQQHPVTKTTTVNTVKHVRLCF